MKYVLTVDIKDDATDPHGFRRLRLALKRMLRGLRIKCVSIRKK